MVLEVQVSGEGNSGGRVLIWACAWLTPEARTTAMVMQWASGVGGRAVGWCVGTFAFTMREAPGGSRTEFSGLTSF